MRFSDVIKMAFRDLGKRKGRTFLTSLAVAVGSMLIVTMVGLGTTAESFLLKQLDKAGMVKKISVSHQKFMSNEEQEKAMSELDSRESYDEFQEKNFKKMDDELVKKLKALNGVDTVKSSISVYISNLQLNGKESGKDIINMVGAGENNIYSQYEIDKVKKDKKINDLKLIVAGRMLNENDKNGILLNEALLKKMGITDNNSVIGKEVVLVKNDVIDQNIKVKPLEMKATVVGVINEAMQGDYNNVYAPITMVSEIKSYYTLTKDYFNTKGYDDLSIIAKDARDVADIDKAIENMGYMYMSYEAIAKQIKKVFVTMEQILSILGIIVLFVAALGTVNTMTMAIHERTRSIGIMKSIGASRKNIHNIFLTQAAAIGFIGGMMGLAFSFLNAKIIEFAIGQFLSKQGVKEVISFSMPTWLILGSLGFAIIVAVISGIYPARKASKLDAIEALNS